MTYRCITTKELHKSKDCPNTIPLKVWNKEFGDFSSLITFEWDKSDLAAQGYSFCICCWRVK